MIIDDGVERRSPHLILSHQEVQECISSIFPNRIADSYIIAKTGLANTNYIIVLDNKKKVVLRIYPEKYNTKKEKESRIAELLLDFPEVPKIHHPRSFTHHGFIWNAVDFVEGVTLAEAPIFEKKFLLEVYFEIGVMLAKLKNIVFPSYGLFGEKLEIQEIKTTTCGFHPIANFIMDCLNHKNLARRAGFDLQNKLRGLAIKQEHVLYKIEQESHLVHGDFKVENILVKRTTNGHMHLSGVLDWEHARVDTSYGDIATLFRDDYDANSIFKREFLRGYESRNISLIEDWDKAIKIIDLINLCYFLCADDDRSLLYRSIMKYLNNTITYFKEGSI